MQVDAFIEAGIGDVSELQKECDSKEEAYNQCYFDCKCWKDKAKEYKHRAERAELALRKIVEDDRAGCLDEKKAVEGMFYFYLKQAEKELQEERKNKCSREKL